MAYAVVRNQLFSSIIMFGSSVILIRALPKEEYGLYVLTLAFFALPELFLVGTDASLVRFIPTSGKIVQHQLIATVLVIKTMIVMIIIIVLWLFYSKSIQILNIAEQK